MDRNWFVEFCEELGAPESAFISGMGEFVLVDASRFRFDEDEGRFVVNRDGDS